MTPVSLKSTVLNAKRKAIRTQEIHRDMAWVNFLFLLILISHLLIPLLSPLNLPLVWMFFPVVRFPLREEGGIFSLTITLRRETHNKLLGHQFLLVIML